MNTTQHAAESLASDAPTNGPDANSRFPHGNPFARRVAELREVMLECVTDKEMEIIVGALMVQAKTGKLAAIKLLFQYVLGKPVATVNPDTLDLQELEQYSRAPEPAAVKDILAARVPADYACNVLRTTLPYLSQSLAELTAESLLGPDPDAEGYDEEAVEPATQPAPSPNGKSHADAARRTPMPQAAAGPDRPAAQGNGRPTPRPPAGG